MKPINEIADHKEAAEILNAEYAALNWHGTKSHGGHLSEDDQKWKYFAWQVAFAPPSKPVVFFDWKAGTGHAHKKGPFQGKPIAPNPAEVLGRCCADYESVKHSSFADWASEFGYDEDSRKAFRVYEDCHAIGSKLQTLGLSRAQVQRFGDLANML